MSILYIITQADGGGAQKYVLALAKHFNGWIACGGEKTALFLEAAKLNIPTFKLKHLKRDISPWHDLWAIFEIKNLIKKLKPDIVHLNSTKAGFLGSIAGRLAGAKVVFTAHGFRFLEPLFPASQWFYRGIEKFAGYFRDYIIAVSKADKNSALQYKLISPDKIAVVYNGIEKIEFFEKEAAKKNLGLATEKKIIGIVANLYKTKGVDTVIKAYPLMSARAIDGSAVAVIGHGPEMQNLKKQISEAGLEEKIILLKIIPDAAKNLKAFDSFVMPSRKEGIPFALLEAMQAGLSTATTMVGGIPEVISDGTVAVPPDNPKALAEGMEKATFDENIKSSNAQKALKQAELFTEEKMLRETEKIYEKVLLTF